MRILFLLLLALSAVTAPALADVSDPFDPFDGTQFPDPDSENDDNKSALELVADAAQLFTEERLLDGRTKLLKALHKDPKQYRVHMMLSGYYIQHVGHFRLALRYALQAQQLFFDKNGKPPYSNYVTENEHKQILYLLAQARLNLDNYQGSFDTLEEFNSYGYYEDWYPGTRSWVLMKLGRLDEAIKVAKLGVLAGGEGGRALNMLGILYSMKGEREQSLAVFKKAIEYELSLGSEGEPATPLNNSGEVYKEAYQDDRAESSWLKAISLPDGCEHVLPSLNLAVLYIDQVNFKGAKRAMDAFESCVAQFPLRNGEEHRAFVEFARGRIDMHTGHADDAIKRLEAALAQRQWFGKIGTDPEDLKAGALISLAQALTVKNNQMRFAQFKSIGERLSWIRQKLANSVRIWWLMRRARQVLAEDLNDFEDLQIRHTDSMLEYSSLGVALTGFPEHLLRKRIEAQREEDKRIGSIPYYKAYLAESLLERGEEDEAFKLLQEVAVEARPQFDRALIVHAEVLMLRFFEPGSQEYAALAEQVFEVKRAELRNYGYRLAVNFVSEKDEPAVIERLGSSAFYLDNSAPRRFTVKLEESETEFVLTFEARNNSIGTIRVRGNDLEEMIQRFNDAVFTEDIAGS